LDPYGLNSAARGAINSMDFTENKDTKEDAFANDDDPERSRWINLLVLRVRNSRQQA
jgi:hypothetical protein